MSVDDSYTYPNSSGVLVNQLKITDAATLDAALNDYVSLGWAEYQQSSYSGPPDFDSLRSIHRHMFRDVFVWAGELRTTDTQATGVNVPYCRPEFIRESIGTLFRKLDQENYLSGLVRREFAEKLADRWGELTAIHPFRDGNTRSQSAWISMLTERAGFTFDWLHIDVEALRFRRLQAVTGDSRPLADYLERSLQD